jgi:hypothetical protein
LSPASGVAGTFEASPGFTRIRVKIARKTARRGNFIPLLLILERMTQDREGTPSLVLDSLRFHLHYTPVMPKNGHPGRKGELVKMRLGISFFAG